MEDDGRAVRVVGLSWVEVSWSTLGPSDTASSTPDTAEQILRWHAALAVSVQTAWVSHQPRYLNTITNHTRHHLIMSYIKEVSCCFILFVRWFVCQQPISVVIPALIIPHSFSLSLQAQNLPLQQIIPILDFFHLLDCLMMMGLDRTYHAHQFIFSSHFNFLFVPCGGLNWLTVSILLHVKCTLSYRIVSYLKIMQEAFMKIFRRRTYTPLEKKQSIGFLVWSRSEWGSKSKSWSTNFFKNFVQLKHCEIRNYQ